MAIAFDKPVVTLFGPTSPQATATHYARESCVTMRLDCQPCLERTCPLRHHRCMRELPVERVYAAVVDMLKTGASYKVA
jgi:heptosyltransferase-2